MERAPPDILTLFPEFHHPMPVDHEFKDLHPLTGAPMGAQARAHVGVLDYTRGDWELAEYRRTAWEVTKQDWRNMTKRMFLFSITGALTTSYTDTGAVARTVQESTNSASASYPGQNAPASGASILRYGSGVTAPTSADNNIQTQLVADILSSVSYDDLNHKTLISGSRVHSEANATINEVALIQKYSDNASTLRTFLVDHSAVSPGVAVTTGQTVAISYSVVF